MKKLFYLLLVATFLCPVVHCQNVGIGETTPLMQLHVTHPDSAIALFNNTQALDVNVKSALYFKTGSWYTGAVKTTGTGTNVARLGFFTFAFQNPNSLLERFSISDNGNVGIGTITPNSLLHINGGVTIADGSQGPNKVLVSDATGLGSWKSSGLNSAFKASHGFNQMVVAGSSYHVTFSSVEYNDAAAFSGSQFTAPEAGVYHFDAMITWDFQSSPLSSNASFAIRLFRGVFLYHEVSAYLLTGVASSYGQTLSCDLKLIPGDIIRIEAYNGSSSSKDILRDVGTIKYVWFSGHRIY